MQQVGTNKWNAIAYGNGRYVVVGDDGYITTSTNTINWNTPIQIKPTSFVGSAYGWICVTFGNGKFVAFGSKGYCTTSTDGINWTTPTQIHDTTFYGIAYGNGYFIAAGTNYVFKSSNGINWSKCNLPLNLYNAIAFGNGMFVITASADAGLVYVSTDNGNTWINKSGMLVYSSAPTNSRFQSKGITFGNGKFVACSYLDVVSSGDGLTWTKPIRIGRPYIVLGKFCDDAFIMGHRNGTVSFSHDGISWNGPIKLMDVDENNSESILWMLDICAMP